MCKKLFAIPLTISMLLCLFAGCSGTVSGSSVEASAAAPVEEATVTENASAQPTVETSDAESIEAQSAQGASAESDVPVPLEGWAPNPGVTYSQGEDVSPRVIDYRYQQDYNLADYRITDPGETMDLTILNTRHFLLTGHTFAVVFRREAQNTTLKKP